MTFLEIDERPAHEALLSLLKVLLYLRLRGFVSAFDAYDAAIRLTERCRSSEHK